MRMLLPIIFTALSALTFGQAAAAADSKDDSKLANFSARSGALIEKSMGDVGVIRGLRIRTMRLTDLISGSKVSGIRFEIDKATAYSSDTKIAFLDADEIDALLKSLEIIKTKILPTAPSSYTEVIFNARSGFSMGCYFSDGKWSLFIKLERYDKDSYFWPKPDELGHIVGYVTAAKGKIAE